MKSKFLIPLVIVLLSNHVLGQQPDSVARHRVDRICKDMSIGTEEAEKVIKILDSYKREAIKVYQDKSLGNEETKEKLKELIETRNKRLKELLKADEYQKLTGILSPKNNKPPFQGGLK